MEKLDVLRAAPEPIKEAIRKRFYAEYLRRDFWEFCLYFDSAFFNKRLFLKDVAVAFQAIAEGRIMKVSVSMPPRAGKSYITSIFCAWWLGRHREACVMRNTVTSSLYRKFSYDVRNIIRDTKYQFVFPSVKLSGDRQNIDGWSLETSKQGAYFGGGVGTNIIGYGANIAITDDLYSGFEQALSTTYDESVHRWKQGSHDSRKERNCPEIFIGTRWSKRDVIGKAIDNGDVDVIIKIPALNEQGFSFCEDVKSTAEYKKIEDESEQMIWMSEYMQEPVEAFGLLFPIDELRFFKDLPSTPEYTYISIDPANKGGDYFASCDTNLIGNQIFIKNVYHNKEGSDANNIFHCEYIVKNKTNAVEYEGVLAWIDTGRKLREMIVAAGNEDCDFRIVQPTTNKITRILVQSSFIKSHFLFREDWKEFPEYKKFMQVLITYLRDQTGINKAKNDDAPDVLAMAAAHYRKEFGHLW